MPWTKRWMYCNPGVCLTQFLSLVSKVILSLPLSPQQIQFADQKRDFNKRLSKTGRRSRSFSQSSTVNYNSGTHTHLLRRHGVFCL